MDLSALGSTLPPGLADAEREMGDKFRAAALSITTLYKASLGATKQAYSVGYSAALADVLATVQSALTAGQDASTALSRLMDWAEARETAMAAFANDEGEEPPTPLSRPVKLSRNPTTTTTNSRPHHVGPSERLQPLEQSVTSQVVITPSTQIANTPVQAPPMHFTQHGRRHNGQQCTIDEEPSTSTSLASMSSPPSATTSRFLPPTNRPSKNLPVKYTTTISAHASTSSSSSSSSTSRSLPSTSFAPTLPFTTEHSAIPPAAMQTPGVVGIKRPIDDQMEDVISSGLTPVTMATAGGGGGGGTGVNPSVGTMLNPNVRGRSAKRRSMGLGGVGVGKDEKDKDKDKDKEEERDRGRRTGRRH